MTASQRQLTPEGFDKDTLDRAVEILLSRVNAIGGDDILTREEAAEYVKFTPNYFDVLVKLNKFRAHRMTVNGSPRFVRSELLEDLRAHLNGTK